MTKERKLKVLFHSNPPFAGTGFGDYKLNVLKYLYKTGKYDLYSYSNGVVENHPDFQRYPWKSMGSIPNDQNAINQINSNPGLAHKAGYGFLNIDKAITTFKPDVYVAIEDIWIQDHCEFFGRFWWNKIPCVTHYTIDSRPLLKSIIDNALHLKHNFSWSNFGTKECHKVGRQIEKERPENAKGLLNTKTIRGLVNNVAYHPLPNYQKLELRKKFNIDNDTFIVGTASRNQLRKNFLGIMEGFVLFQKNNSNVKSKLLYLTDFRETGSGWDLERGARELGLKNEDLLACYKCRQSGEHFILPFLGQELDNPKNPNIKKSLVTIGVNDLITVEQLNECFNLFDCFCLTGTSFGFELNICQSMSCEIPALTNSYSATEDYFDDDTGVLMVEQAFTREAGSGFIKSAPYPSSIAKQIKKVYEMTPLERKKLGQKGRKWVLENASIEVVGKKWEELLDSLPLSDYDFQPEQPKQKNPAAQIPIIIDDAEWVKNLYIFILGDREDGYDKEGLKHWVEKLKSGMPRQQIENYFREVAAKDIEKNKIVKFEDLIDKTDKKRLLVVLKESGGDIINACSILENLKKSYPNHDIYFGCDPKFHELLDGNPYIYRALPYIDQMESELWAIGTGTNKGLFDVFIHLGIQNQRQLNYLSNNNLSIELT